jgi:hypothetical protein
VWDHSVFSKNRARLNAQAVAAEFPSEVVRLAADKAYDTADFVADCRTLGVTPHVAQNTSGRRSAIAGRTTHPPGYGLSLKIRAWIETNSTGSRQRQVCGR